MSKHFSESCFEKAKIVEIPFKMAVIQDFSIVRLYSYCTIT